MNYFKLNSTPSPDKKKIIKFFTEATEFLKKLNEECDELKKQKAMKITKDAKIKDLIPEGYKLYEDGITFQKEYSSKGNVVCNLKLCARKVKVKDFKWYCEKYFEAKYHEFADGTKIVTSYTNSYEAQKIINGEFDQVQFESKIGLLKFICDDIEVNIMDGINGLIVTKSTFTDNVHKKLQSICPPEFLNSIFK